MSPWTALLVGHVVAASVSLPLGAYQLWRRPRGDLQHRLLGRVWAVLMMWTALSSFWIRELNEGELSFIHILSVVTVVSLVVGVWRIRRGDVRTHLGSMRGAWIGSLGAFLGAVVVPARMIPTLAVESPATFGLAVAAVLAIAAALILGCRAVSRDHALEPAQPA